MSINDNSLFKGKPINKVEKPVERVLMCVLMCFFHGNEHVVICNRNENYTTLPIGIDLREHCFFVDIHVHVRTLRALWLDHNKRQSQWSDAKAWLIMGVILVSVLKNSRFTLTSTDHFCIVCLFADLEEQGHSDKELLKLH